MRSLEASEKKMEDDTATRDEISKRNHLEQFREVNKMYKENEKDPISHSQNKF